MSQSIGERQAVVLVQEVNRRARPALVSLHDADAVLFDEHGQLHVASSIDNLQLSDWESAQDILNVCGETRPHDDLALEVVRQANDRTEPRYQVHLCFEAERLLLLLGALHPCTCTLP